MITSASPRKPSQRLLLIALFLTALLLRLFRAHQLAIISPDAIRYILQAQALTSHPVQAMRDEVFHPLFSLCILAIHATCQLLHPATTETADRLAWIHSAQALAIFCGALIAPLIFALARQFGARFWPALAAGLMWALTKRTSVYGAEANSDTLALVLFAGSMLLAMRAISFRHGTLNRAGALQLAASGLLAGLAYLTRPEGLAAPLLILLTLALWCLRGKSSRRTLKFLPRRALPTTTFLKAAAILLAFTALPAVPYMLTIHGLTHKKALTLNPVPPEAAAPESPIADSPHQPPAAQWLLDETAKTFSYPCLAILVLGLLFHLRLSGRPRLRLLAMLWLLLWLALMLWLLKTAGYLNARHTLPLQLLLFSWLALALQNWQRLAQRTLSLLHFQRSHCPAIFAAIVFLIFAIRAALQLNSPPLGNQDASAALAANWAKDNLRDDILIADRQLLVGYLSGHPFTRWLGTPKDPALYSLPSAPHPIVLGQLYQPGDPIPPSLGPYRPLALVQITPTKDIRGEIYILYALPNASVLKPSPPE